MSIGADESPLTTEFSDRFPSTLRGRPDRSEQVGNRGLIPTIWRCTVCSIRRDIGEVWTDSTAFAVMFKASSE